VPLAEVFCNKFERGRYGLTLMRIARHLLLNAVALHLQVITYGLKIADQVSMSAIDVALTLSINSPIDWFRSPTPSFLFFIQTRC
jgi:hypothetical protein